MKPIWSEGRSRFVAYLAFVAALAVVLSGVPAMRPVLGGSDVVPGLKVAFIGDQGLGPDSEAVLSLIKREGAAMVLHSGDFDYADNPAAWDAQINKVLGPSFPYFVSVGNHDEQMWPEYQRLAVERLARVNGAQCDGDYGVQAACTYQGLFFVLSGVGTIGRNGHAAYISEQLAADSSTWSICSWHKDQHDMQVGSKHNETGWDVYQACQNGGAIVATAHEHSYSRTLTLTDVGNRRAGHGATGRPDVMEVSPGRTFVFVSGLGGDSKRDFDNRHLGDTWWATYYTATRYLLNGALVPAFDYDFGALFITFNVDGDPRKARGEFKNIGDQTIDMFEIHAF